MVNILEQKLLAYNGKPKQLKKLDRFFKKQSQNFKHYNWWIPWN